MQDGWELMGSSHTQMLLTPWGIIASKFSSHPRALVASPPSGTGLDGFSGVWSLYRFHKMQNAAPFVKCACKHFLLKVAMTTVETSWSDHTERYWCIWLFYRALNDCMSQCEEPGRKLSAATCVSMYVQLSAPDLSFSKWILFSTKVGALNVC